MLLNVVVCVCNLKTYFCIESSTRNAVDGLLSAGPSVQIVTLSFVTSVLIPPFMILRVSVCYVVNITFEVKIVVT